MVELVLPGRGRRNRYGMRGEFGFFVHCLVAAQQEDVAFGLVTQDLDEDELTVVDVPFSGKFDCLEWNDPVLEEELSSLASEALACTGRVFFSTFHSWRV